MLAGVELIEKLGQGGMGVVWKARQLSLDRLVAIKVIPPEMIRSPDDVRMILQEARAAARLKHPGIVQIHDACEQDGTYYLVMEHVEGYNLGQWLARRKQLATKDVLLIAESVATALDYAWQATGLIHCDIKPENVMVDQDGTIKVADLGLSRTRDTKDGAEIDEIMGTPAYMSPEQVQGDRRLDCRADIYSLGAMMYHLLTGIRPFSDRTDDEAMASQITGYLCDPRDVVPAVPGCVCALIERMMVKDRDARPADWARVLADLRRVGKGMMPSSPAPAPGTSTMTCRKVAARKSGKVQDAMHDAERGGFPWRIVIPLIVLAAGGGLYGYFMQAGRSNPSESSPTPSVLPGSAPAPERAVESLQLLEETRRWMRANSNAYESAFSRYHAIVERFPDTAAASMALEDMKRLRLRQSGEVEAAWSDIQARADQFMEQDRFDQALAFLEEYAGAWRAETASNRMELAKAIRAKVAAGEVARAQSEAWDVFLGQTADLILASSFKAALDGVQEAVKTRTYPGRDEALAELASVLEECLASSVLVRQSFAADVGKVFLLPVGRARTQVRITGLSGQRIAGTMVDTGAEVLIPPDDLPLDERLRRLGDGSTPGTALAKGVLAVAGRMWPLGEEMFGRAGGVLSKVLQGKLRQIKAGMGTEQVSTALSRVLNAAGISVGPYSEGEWIKAIEGANPSPDRARLVNAQREKFLMDYGASEFAMRATPVLLALERQCRFWAEAHPEIATAKDVKVAPAAGPNEEQATIVRRVVELNPGVQPRDVTTYSVNGSTGLKIVSDSIVDVGFLMEGGGVKGLWLEAKGGSDLKIDVKPLGKAGVVDLRLKGYVPKDLSVLRSIPLRHLTLTGINTASYSWLEGLSLVELDLSGSGLRELSVLRGMRLQTLVLDHSKVTGVAPLAGMPLRELSLKGTAVRDIVVLRGLPLVGLDLSQTPVTDCSILRGVNLTSLDLSGTGVRDVSFCASMPLERLAVSGTAVDDISALRGKNFKRLVLSRTCVTDISPLAGATIVTLDISGTKIPPVNLLRVLPKIRVQELCLEDMEVTRLDCLQGQPLTRLSLKGTRVSDISPLAGMPLRILDLRGLRLMDTSVLHSISSLEQLWCDVDGVQAGVLFDRIPNLKSVNGQGRSEYVRW